MKTLNILIYFLLKIIVLEILRGGLRYAAGCARIAEISKFPCLSVIFSGFTGKRPVLKLYGSVLVNRGDHNSSEVVRGQPRASGSLEVTVRSVCL